MQFWEKRGEGVEYAAIPTISSCAGDVQQQYIFLIC